MKRQLFETVTAPIHALFKKANAFNVNLVERFHPIYEIKLSDDSLKFSCPNQMSLWRAQTLFSKEPDTIKWINSFADNAILYDVGANVGMYALYAAAKKNIHVYAFEPESQNYAALNRNIFINHLQDKINAYNIAISDQARLGHLYLKEFTIGGALNNFGECVNYKKEPFAPGFKQAVTSFPLNDLIDKFNLPVPHHLKIDVDGLEAAVIAGADHLLKELELKSILIELNTDLAADNAIIPHLKNFGFILQSHYRSPAFVNSPFKNIYNHIFSRP